MNTIVFFLLCFLCLVCFSLSVFSCLRTYNTIVTKKKERRILRYVRNNRGKIGQAQQWRCWQCHSVMLSDYEIVLVEEELVAAVCTLCSSSEKYRHIYTEDKGVEAPKDSYV